MNHLKLSASGSLCKRLFSVLKCLVEILCQPIGLDNQSINAAIFFIGEALHLGKYAYGLVIIPQRLIQNRLINKENTPILLLAFGVAAVGFFGLLEKFIREFQGFFEPAFISIEQH